MSDADKPTIVVVVPVLTVVASGAGYASAPNFEVKAARAESVDDPPRRPLLPRIIVS